LQEINSGENLSPIKMNVSNKVSDRLLPTQGQEKRSANHLPRFLETAAVTIILTFITVLIFSFLFIRWNQDTLYFEKVQTGKIVLNHLVHSVPIPLLEDDTLALNTFVKETKNIDGFLYAMIVDSKKTIKAHTDPAKIGAAFEEWVDTKNLAKNGNVTQIKYFLPTGIHVLNLSKPVMYKDKVLGAVHLGLSADFLNALIKKQTLFFVRKIIFWGLFALAMAMGAAIFLSWRMKRSIDRQVGIEPAAGIRPPLQRGSFPREALDGGVMETGNIEGPLKVTRNHVTVLFAGVKGFKVYANTKVVEEVLNDLNEYFTIATKCILEHGGYVDKFLGDAVIGVFGNSPLQTDHTERAVKSAVAMLKVLQNASKNGNQLLCKVGIGICSGVVLSGYIGTPDTKEYASIGESFKGAYLLNVMAGPGEIVLSKDVYQTVKSFVSVEPLPPREILQKTGPWENFRLRHIQ